MGAAVELSKRKRTLIFINSNISTIAGTLLTTALTTALPPIMKDFNISVNTAQWLTSGFNLTMAIIIPLTSYLINRFRTKKLFLTALALFIIGLTIALYSVNFYMMLFGRIIQAGGSALISSLAQVVILTIYPPEQRGYAMGWYGLALGAAPIVAPTISGLLVDSVGWRMIFVLSISIMVVTFIYTIFVFEDVIENHKVHLDIISFLLSGITFGGVTLAIGNFGSYKFLSYQVFMILIIGVVAGILFTYRQLHIKIPFLDLHVFQHRDFSIAVITTIIIQLILMGSAVIFPLLFQDVMGRTATISGLAVLPGSLALSIVSPFAGKIYDKIGIKLLFLFTGFFSTFSNLSLFFINNHTNIWVIIVINIVRCIAVGVLTMPVITWGMRQVPDVKTADGSATLNSFRILSMGIGSALFVSIMTTVRDYVKDHKEEPELFGINVVFLSMAFLSFIILLFGIFGCESKFLSSCKGNKDAKNSLKEIKEKKEDLIKETNSNEEKVIEVIIDNFDSQSEDNEKTIISSDISDLKLYENSLK